MPATDWNERLSALTITLPPAHQRTAIEYVHHLKRLDTDPSGARPYVLAADDANLDLFNTIANTIGDEVARRRWLLALVDHLVAVVAAAADEAQRREDQADEDALDVYGFTQGARFVQAAVMRLLDTANDRDDATLRGAVTAVVGRGGYGYAAGGTASANIGTVVTTEDHAAADDE